MTNTDLATELLGYTPAGYIVVAQVYNMDSPWSQTGAVYVDGRCIYIFNAGSITA